MARRTFYNISIEESNAPVENTSISAVEVIEAQEANENIEQITRQMTEDAATMEEAMGVVEELQAQQSSNAEKLEGDPNAITEEDVQSSQMALEHAYIKLGYPIDHIKKHRVSLESARTPYEKLKLSNEGILDLIDSVINFFTAGFDKILNACQDIYNWLSKLFMVKKKTIVELSNKFNALPNKNVELTPKQLETAIQKYPWTVLHKDVNNFDQLVGKSKIELTLAAIREIDNIVDFENNLNNIPKGVTSDGSGLAYIMSVGDMKKIITNYYNTYVKGIVKAFNIKEDNGASYVVTRDEIEPAPWLAAAVLKQDVTWYQLDTIKGENARDCYNRKRDIYDLSPKKLQQLLETSMYIVENFETNIKDITTNMKNARAKMDKLRRNSSKYKEDGVTLSFDVKNIAVFMNDFLYLLVNGYIMDSRRFLSCTEEVASYYFKEATFGNVEIDPNQE